MSPFLKEHLFGALVLGAAFGTAIRFSAITPQPGPIPGYALRCFLGVIAIILVKMLFDAGRQRIRMMLLTTQLEGHPSMRCHLPII